MQLYENSYKINLKMILAFFIIMVVGLFPVATFLFALKNDAFTGYFPPKFFMSESIHSGSIPLWNPYINFGIPQYGDMSSGFWSPITWFFSSTIGYNAYTFTIELLMYIFIGGIGMFKLLSYWGIYDKIKFIAGISFMLCGFNIGHLQHFNWISGVSFLPWCLWSYLILLKKYSLKNAILTALIFYLFVSSAHPGISIVSVYFFFIVFLFSFFQNKTETSFLYKIKYFSKVHFLFILFFLLLSAGMIAGYLDIIPHFSRGDKLYLENSLGNTTSLKCWISTIIPFSTVKNDAFFNTDISMRNCYFGLTLLIFLLYFIFSTKTKWQVLFFLFGMFTALLSLGKWFKTIGYYLMPGISYVRLNGEFRIFSIFCFIIIAALEVNKYFETNRKFDFKLKYIFIILNLVLVSAVLYGLYGALHYKSGILFSFNIFKNTSGFVNKLKLGIDIISFNDTFWIQGVLQLLLLFIIHKSLLKKDIALLKKVIIVELVLASLMNIPFTGVGKLSVANIQKILSESKKGIPIPALTTIEQHNTQGLVYKEIVGDWSMYSKQIGCNKAVPYPIVLKNTTFYFDSLKKNSNISVTNKPFIFLANYLTDSVNTFASNNLVIKDFEPNKIEFFTNSNANSNIFYLQNYYPHWYFNNGLNYNPMKKAGINFMSAPIKKGNWLISFSFEPTVIKCMMVLSLTVFIILLFLLLFYHFKQPSLSKPHLLNYP